MSNDREVVAKRYALALFDLAKASGKIDEVEQQLNSVNAVLAESKELKNVLEHPKVTTEKKKTLLKDIFSSTLSNEVLNTLYILIDRKREEVLEALVRQFTSLANKERGLADATVYSVKALSDSEMKALTEVFAKRLGVKSLRVTNEIDSELIGGIKLVVGNQVFDGSVLAQLNRIQRNLTSA
jgi:F-type H+-transporting ATPase subunit delta